MMHTHRCTQHNTNVCRLRLHSHTFDNIYAVVKLKSLFKKSIQKNKKILSLKFYIFLCRQNFATNILFQQLDDKE